MRRTKMILAVAAVMVATLAMAPGSAMAQDFDDGFFVVEDDDGFFFAEGDDFDFFDDGFFFVEGDGFDFFDGSFGGDGISQSFEQESESGEVDQSFEVS